MKYPSIYDDIRPFDEEEIVEAMQEIASDNTFPMLANFVFPDKSFDEVKALFASLKTIDDFQSKVMYQANKQIMARSITNMTVGGMEKLDTKRRYLFVSNHRDIMLDASLLQNSMKDYGHETAQITFGANLMRGDMVVNIGKSNKMFRVERGGNMKVFYESSKHLSDYIRYVITERGESVWIAQRNGRTKNGDDRTDQGIIKMFCMSKREDKVSALVDLNIVPVSVSYEWEPCDILKAMELYVSSIKTYEKTQNEDLHSILTGILQTKGRVHFEICDPIREEELEALKDLNSGEYHKQVAKLVDQRIHSAYRLYPNNYIAYDKRFGGEKYKHCYTEVEKELFEQHVNVLDTYPEFDKEQLEEILLDIYSNPVVNKEN
ncbi:MAG: 1-acyl-sn-glycerol-3-phosphate acyltransferase [Bacteroidales bacterium]|nr:1-acyl-sn-glycerol-3-phosphate acyltransferase [Bacteroidales bacterium]